MSDSVRPHRRQPTRLPRPWDSPGKKTGVGCHFLLQCVKVKSESEVAQLCPTLSDLMDCSLPDSCVHGIFQARVLEWVAITFSTKWHSHYERQFGSCIKWNKPGGREPREGGAISIFMADLCCCTAETNIILYSNYPPIKYNFQIK